MPTEEHEAPSPPPPPLADAVITSVLSTPLAPTDESERGNQHALSKMQPPHTPSFTGPSPDSPLSPSDSKASTSSLDAASQDLATEEKAPVVEGFDFYMDNSPQQKTRVRNSELLGDEDEDDMANEMESCQNGTSSSSQATVAESAMTKLIGLAIAVPNAFISADGEERERDQQPCQAEIYLEDTGTEAGLPRERSEGPVPLSNSDHDNESNCTSSSSCSSAASMSTASTVSAISTDATTRPCDIDASKDILTEGQAFAYVGLCLVTANTLFQALEGTETAHAKESLESFVSKLINRLYRHLDIDASTQRTIAQLPQMMIQPEDLLETFVADGTQRVVSSQQVDQSIRSDSTASSRPSVSSVPRQSISSQGCNNSGSRLSTDEATPEPLNKVHSRTIEESTQSRSSTPANEPSLSARVSTSSQRAITVDLRWTLIADLFLISISDSVYDSRARVLLKTVGRHLGLEWSEIVQFEKGIMKQLQQSTASDGLLKPDTKSRNDESRKRRMIMMGLATVGGGLVLGLSAGLFAPVIGAGIGAALAGAHITGATATAASAFLAGSGGIAVITSGAAVTGSGLAMKKMARRTAGIDTFEFLNITDNKRVNVILTISGWLDIGDEDASLPFSTLDPVNGDHFALFWEPEMLMQLGNALGLLATEVITLTAQEILKHTLLSALLSALAWPMALTRLGYLIDNPWSIALDRAKLAGLVLADSLLMRSYLGFRPVTLVGYSLGARVIFYCLLELGRLDAFGIVEDVYLFGAPVTASQTQWRQARSAVAGDFVNGYLRNDWVLGFLFRATTGGLGTVAGLRPITNVPGLTNMDLTTHVEGHLDYRVKIPLLMKLMGLKITSESFLEKEEAILYQRSLKINPNETLKAPKPMMPSKEELAKSGALSDKEKMQLEVAFRRPAPKAKIPNLDEITGLTPEEKQALREALEAAATAQTGPPSPLESRSKRK
ncbi:hypothetical protein BGZ72_007328 [Mortierella alpina]|nr:hypothetical protein BGZ72_007328 [Mortierella alpina]